MVYFISFSDFIKGYEDEKSAKDFVNKCNEKAGEQNG